MQTHSSVLHSASCGGMKTYLRCKWRNEVVQGKILTSQLTSDVTESRLAFLHLGFLMSEVDLRGISQKQVSSSVWTGPFCSPPGAEEPRAAREMPWAAPSCMELNTPGQEDMMLS